MKLIGLCDRGPKCYIRLANILMTMMTSCPTGSLKLPLSHRTAFHFACFYGHLHLVIPLFNDCEINHQGKAHATNEGRSAIQFQ